MGAISDTYDRATAEELKYMAGHPWNAYCVSQVRSKAYERTQALYEPWTWEDGIGDAFRHAFASAMLAREIGVSEAYTVTDMHENIPENPHDKKTMDLFNNNVGIHLYLEARDAVRAIWEDPDAEPSDELLERRVQDAVRRGKTKVILTQRPGRKK